MEKFNQLIEIIQGKKKGLGEDSFCFNCSPEARADMISIFDGCGGAGARRYANLGDHTGAYHASRIASGVFYDWFRDEFKEAEISSWGSQIKDNFKRALDLYKNCNPVSKIAGGMFKEYPTTMAGAVIYGDQSNPKVHFMWAGDSRCFIMNSTGLYQTTKDDVNGGLDAMTNLKEDGALSNLISASKEIVINEQSFKLQNKSMVICSSDGCFGYLPSPIHFEHMLERFLLDSANMNEWKMRIVQYLEKISGDDFSMLIYMYGYESFDDMRDQMYQRCSFIEREYIKPWENCTNEQREELWAKYYRELSGV